MCDTQKYYKIYKEINKLSAEDTLQLIKEAPSKEEQDVESLNTLSVVVPLCNQTILYDNTEKIRRFAIYEGENLISISDDIPRWYANSSLFQNRV